MFRQLRWFLLACALLAGCSKVRPFAADASQGPAREGPGEDATIEPNDDAESDDADSDAADNDDVGSDRDAEEAGREADGGSEGIRDASGDQDAEAGQIRSSDSYAALLTSVEGQFLLSGQLADVSADQRLVATLESQGLRVYQLPEKKLLATIEDVKSAYFVGTSTNLALYSFPVGEGADARVAIRVWTPELNAPQLIAVRSIEAVAPDDGSYLLVRADDTVLVHLDRCNATGCPTVTFAKPYDGSYSVQAPRAGAHALIAGRILHVPTEELEEAVWYPWGAISDDGRRVARLGPMVQLDFSIIVRDLATGTEEQWGPIVSRGLGLPGLSWNPRWTDENHVQTYEYQYRTTDYYGLCGREGCVPLPDRRCRDLLDSTGTPRWHYCKADGRYPISESAAAASISELSGTQFWRLGEWGIGGIDAAGDAAPAGVHVSWGEPRELYVWAEASDYRMELVMTTPLPVSLPAPRVTRVLHLEGQSQAVALLDWLPAWTERPDGPWDTLLLYADETGAKSLGTDVTRALMRRSPTTLYFDSAGKVYTKVLD